MVTPVSSASQYSPYITSLLDPIPSTGKRSSSAPTTTSSSSDNTPTSVSTNSSLVSSLLSGGSFSPEVLSLLQPPGSNGDFNPITDLLSGSGPNNAVTDLLSSLYTTSASAAVTQAQNAANPAKATNPTGGSSSSSTTSPNGANIINNLINTATQASVAYDNTLFQNAKAVLNSINQTA